MVGMSQSADEYWPRRLDLVSGDGRDYSDEETVRIRLEEWEDVFAAPCRGSTPCLSRAAIRATRQPIPDGAAGKADRQPPPSYHPQAEMWMSPQGFSADWMDEFFGIIKARARVAQRHRLRPAGPHRSARAAEGLAAKLSDPPVSRHHPSAPCQYPVPDWDLAHRPRRGASHQSAARRQSPIFRLFDQHRRLSHLLRRLQRRRQQVRLEPPGLGPVGGSALLSSAITPGVSSGWMMPMPTASPRASSPSNGTGAGRC